MHVALPNIIDEMASKDLCEKDPETEETTIGVTKVVRFFEELITYEP